MSPPARPWRPFALLAAAVAAAHLVVLEGLPRRHLQAPPAASQPWVVARVALPPDAVATAPHAPRSGAKAQAPPIRQPAPAGSAAAAGAAAPSPQTGIPASVAAPLRLHYAVSAHLRGTALEGRSTLTWQHDGERYEAEWTVTGPPPLARRQRSIGHLTPQGLAPQRYAERLRSEQAVHFDRHGQRLVFSAQHPQAPLPPAAQDRLSVLLQVAALLTGRSTARATGSTITLPVATVQSLEDWSFTVEDEEELQLPGGPLRALRLSRPPNGEFAPHLAVWLDPWQAYAPVRLRLTLPLGDWIEHQWSGTDRP